MYELWEVAFLTLAVVAAMVLIFKNGYWTGGVNSDRRQFREFMKETRKNFQELREEDRQIRNELRESRQER